MEGKKTQFIYCLMFHWAFFTLILSLKCHFQVNIKCCLLALYLPLDCPTFLQVLTVMWPHWFVKQRAFSPSQNTLSVWKRSSLGDSLLLSKAIKTQYLSSTQSYTLTDFTENCQKTLIHTDTSLDFWLLHDWPLLSKHLWRWGGHLNNTHLPPGRQQRPP